MQCRRQPTDEDQPRSGLERSPHDSLLADLEATAEHMGLIQPLADLQKTAEHLGLIQPLALQVVADPRGDRFLILLHGHDRGEQVSATVACDRQRARVEVQQEAQHQQ